MALKSAQLDAVYLAIEPRDFERFLSLADDENFRGFSITAPFKAEALRLATERDEASTSVGAANTLVRDGKGWRAYNTDVSAVADCLERAFRVHGATPGRPVALGAARVLVLGTGGAARAVLGVLRSVGARAVVAGRDEARALELGREFGAEGIAWSAIAGCEHDVLVNCTPLGTTRGTTPGTGSEEELPIPADWIRPGSLVLDAVYRPVRTPLLVAARDRGCTVVPGGEWFVRQAREQFKLFTQREADESMVRAAFQHAISPTAAAGTGRSA
jgi:shikimate dehydrogenase